MTDKEMAVFLVKENAELKLKLQKLTQHLESQKMTALFEQVEDEVRQEQRIEDLEKQVSAMSKALVLNTSDSDKEKLTKAKEIIKSLISQNRKLWVYSDVRERAEQFLKELEK